ncbi:hypothetical protein UK82_11845 [Frankia sp. ACN1ag]|nr:hypothetical protein UK82_11845 [Frankia sp. ACN1ag]
MPAVAPTAPDSPATRGGQLATVRNGRGRRRGAAGDRRHPDLGRTGRRRRAARSAVRRRALRRPGPDRLTRSLRRRPRAFTADGFTITSHRRTGNLAFRSPWDRMVSSERGVRRRMP